MTRPVRPEKSMATREFSDTLRCEGTWQGGGGRGGVGLYKDGEEWVEGGGGSGVDKGQRSNKPDTVTGA